MRAAAHLASVLVQAAAGTLLARLLMEHLWPSAAPTWPQTMAAGIGIATATLMWRRKGT
jgi:hypothetical protein